VCFLCPLTAFSFILFLIVFGSAAFYFVFRPSLKGLYSKTLVELIEQNDLGTEDNPIPLICLSEQDVIGVPNTGSLPGVFISPFSSSQSSPACAPVKNERLKSAFGFEVKGSTRSSLGSPNANEEKDGGVDDEKMWKSMQLDSEKLKTALTRHIKEDTMDE
jgi:hypothetical protein